MIGDKTTEIWNIDIDQKQFDIDNGEDKVEDQESEYMWKACESQCVSQEFWIWSKYEKDLECISDNFTW